MIGWDESQWKAVFGRTLTLHNIIGDAQPQAGSLRSFFSGEKRLHDFVFDLIGDAGAVVFNFDDDVFSGFFCTYDQRGNMRCL